MRLLDRVTDRLLRIAADRWSADLRDTMLSEWRAEIAWLREQPGTGWRQWRYAVSLAVRSPHDQAIVRRLSPLVRSLIVLSVAGVALFPLMSSAHTVVDRLAPLVPADQTAVQGIGYVISSLVLALVFGWLGWMAAKRFPLSMGDRWWSDAATALATVVAMSFWLVVMWGFEGRTLLGWPVLLLSFLPLVWVVVWLFRTGRTRWGWAVGVIGGWLNITALAVAETAEQIIWYAAADHVNASWPPIEPWTVALWGLGSLADGNFGPGVTPSSDPGAFEFTPSMLGSFYLVFLMFAVTYAVRSRRQPRPVPGAVVVSAAAPATPMRDRVAVVLAVTGILTWAVALTLVAPNVTRALGYFTAMRLETWEYGIRLAAVLLTVLALCTMLIGRRRVLIPATVHAAGLMVMDRIAMSSDWTGGGNLLLLAGSAGALTVAVYVAAMRLGRPTEGASRGLATIAVTSAAIAPVVVMHWTPDQPLWIFLVITIILMLALAALAGVAVAALLPADRDPASLTTAQRVFVNPMARLVGFPVALTAAALLMLAWQSHSLMVGVLIGPVAVLVAAAAGWSPWPRHSPLRRWLTVAAIAVAVSLLLVLSNFLGLKDMLFPLTPMELGGRPLMAGAVVIIPVIGALLESRIDTAAPVAPVARSRVTSEALVTD